MNHAEHLVDLVDKDGNVVGNKQRQEIDKTIDLYHTVFVVISTPDNKLILSKIPSRTDLPNLYAGNIGATVATIRRHNETADEASSRVVNAELFIKEVQLTHIGDTHLMLPDERNMYASVYRGIHVTPKDFSHKDIESLLVLNRSDLDEAVRVDKTRFSSTFLAIWQKYKNNLF
jgi:hypothetical protein